MAVLRSISGWLEGKKTYLAAAALVVLGGAVLWTGLGDPMIGLSLLITGFGLFGLRDHAQRNAAFVANEIADLKALLAQPGRKDVGGYVADLVNDLQKYGIVNSSDTPPDEGRAAIGASTDTKSAGTPAAAPDPTVTIEIETIARNAYRAYAESKSFENLQGEPLPEFDQLPAESARAWRSAAAAGILK